MGSGGSQMNISAPCLWPLLILQHARDPSSRIPEEKVFRLQVHQFKDTGLKECPTPLSLSPDLWSGGEAAGWKEQDRQQSSTKSLCIATPLSVSLIWLRSPKLVLHFPFVISTWKVLCIYLTEYPWCLRRNRQGKVSF